MKRPLLTALACAGAAALGGIAWALHDSAAPTTNQQQRQQPLVVDIDYPEPLAVKKTKSGSDDEDCRTGCSLAKHDIPPFTYAQFDKALADYAKAEPDAPSKALETLLFYRIETEGFLEAHGKGPLSDSHLAFLKKELAVKHARVSIRVVDGAGKVRVQLKDVLVPLGVKQHLKPKALDGTQPLEFNGTVMRVGLYHLWSRY